MQLVYALTLLLSNLYKTLPTHHSPLWNVAAILDDAHLLDSPQAASVAADVGVQYLRWHCRQKVRAMQMLHDDKYSL